VKVGITGGLGFIGTWLRDELSEAGHNVAVIDRNAGGLYRADLLDPGVFADYLRSAEPDVVVHLAAQVGRIFSEDDVRRTVRLNAEMTAIVAQACGNAGVRLAYASTSEIYGDQGDRLCHEDGPQVLPQGAYGLTKRWGEEASQLYAPDGLVIFRPSMPYGPGSPPGRGRRAMDTMLWQAHHRMPITVHRGAERSWCWVGDTVRGIRLAIEQPAGVYNIGRDDDPRSMLEVARLACKLAGAPEDLIVEVVAPGGQTVVKRLATDRLRALGWAPTVELEDGMERVYEHVRRYDTDGIMR
jgi:nucleoside-diphosphate-sugar epimerase